MFHLKRSFILLFVLSANLLVGATPEESVQKLTAILQKNEYGSLPQLCIPSIRHYAGNQIRTDQGRIQKFLQGSCVRSEKFQDNTLLFYRTAADEGGEMILIFNPDGLLMTTPIILDAPLPQLNQKEMCEDFDFLMHKMEETFSLDEVNRQVFGLDFRQVLNSYRAKISEEMSILEFTALVMNALNDCKGNHLWVADVLLLIKGSSAAKEAIEALIAPSVESSAAGVTHALFKIAYLNKILGPLTLKYFDGEYYNCWPLVQGEKRYPAGMKLTSIDGEAISSVLHRLQPHLSAYDANRNIFFGQSFTHVQHNIYLLCKNADALTFQINDSEEITIRLSEFRSDMQKPSANSAQRIGKTVLYLGKPEVLYIRVPEMQMNDTDFYLSEMAKQGKNKKIRAVVLDVRYNSGGSDLVWQDILQMLIDQEYTYVTKMGCIDSATGRSYFAHHRRVIEKFFPEYFASSRSGSSDQTGVKIPFLGERNFLVSSTVHRLTPRPESLRLKCPVYIIAHDVYSSTGGLISVAAQLDFMTSVGLPSADILGKGIDPLFHSLPNSKIIFSNSPEIDLSNCKNAFDVLHLKMENELNLSSKEYFDYLNSDVSADLKEYLIHRDPFFRQVIKLLETPGEE